MDILGKSDILVNAVLVVRSELCVSQDVLRLFCVLIVLLIGQ